MKGRNFSVCAQRVKYVVMDFIMTSAAFMLFNMFRYHALGIENEYPDVTGFLLNHKLVLEQIFVPVGIMCIYWVSGYYNRPFDKSRLSEFTTTLMSVLVSTIILFLALLINDTTGVKVRDYEMIVVLFGTMFVMTYLGRWFITSRTISHLRKGHWQYTTLIIGNSRKSRDVARLLHEGGSVWAYNVVGFIRLPGEEGVEDDRESWNWDEVESICREKDVDQIILAPEKIRDADIMNILERLFPLERPVKIAPDTLSYITGNIKLDDILGTPFIDLTSPRMSEFQKNVKRAFDVTASAVTLLLFSPVYAATAMAVKLTSPGPVIYRQERVGKGHRPFHIYKFRSMRNDAERHGPQLSTKEDRRITPFGQFMRKYRIDELPQFWNVLRGDMSIVGPRPERQYFIERIVERAPYYGLVFQVRPGITSWGMVKYGYASSVEEMVERSRFDLLYLNNMSIATDIKIMIYTVKTVLSGAGV